MSIEGECQDSNFICKMNVCFHILHFKNYV